MATVNGVHYPVGSDTYDLPADWLLHAQTDAQQALDAAAAAVEGLAPTDPSLPYLRMPNDADWGTIPDGIYQITTYAHALQLTPALPTEMLGAGILRAMTATPGVRTYEVISAGGREMWLNSRTAGVYTGWRKVTTGGLDFKRIDNGANWSNVADGVYQITTLAHAQGLTPALPAAMAGAGILRVTSPSADLRLYEFIGPNDRGTWRNSRAAGVFAGWTRLTTGGLDFKRIDNGANWSTQPDGIYRIETLPHAQGLTPVLPDAMAGAGTLHITSPSTTVRTFEFVATADRGIWHASSTSGTVSAWVRLGASGEYATKEELGVYVIEGDERLYNPRPPMDTGWNEVTTGLELRRTGQQAHARATALATTGGVILATIPGYLTPAGHTDISFGGAAGYINDTGLHLSSTDPATVSGVVTWLTDAPWEY